MWQKETFSLLFQKHQKNPIRFGAGWSFHLSAQDDKLLAQERIFCHEFGLLW
jgi:hypothetical protein